jgi:predicted RNase H-like nuclease (RuvC/YqgF family)
MNKYKYNFLNYFRAEARNLRSKLQECSTQRIMEADYLFLVQQENKGLKDKIMKHEATIEELEMKLEKLIKRKLIFSCYKLNI